MTNSIIYVYIIVYKILNLWDVATSDFIIAKREKLYEINPITEIFHIKRKEKADFDSIRSAICVFVLESFHLRALI